MSYAPTSYCTVALEKTKQKNNKKKTTNKPPPPPKKNNKKQTKKKQKTMRQKNDKNETKYYTTINCFKDLLKARFEERLTMWSGRLFHKGTTSTKKE